MDRRALLGTLAGSSIASLAGCLDQFGADDDDERTDDDELSVPRPEAYGDELPLVQDPPAAVYIPTHREGMVMPDPVRAGEYAVGPMVGQAHPFWLVTGETVELVEVQPADDVHLMLTVWDPDTGTVLPTDEGLWMEVYKDGTLVEELPPWSMLSQSMGFHFGDNVPLDGDGTYEVRVEVPPIGSDKTGAFDGRFEAGATASFEFTFDQALRDRIFEGLDMVEEDNWGVRGAIDPGHGMNGDHSHGDHAGHDDSNDEHGHDEHTDSNGEHEHSHDDLGHPPFSELPDPEALPGAPLHDTSTTPPSSGDATVPATIVNGGGRFADDHYLLVSPRTPHNQNPLPSMALTATTENDDGSTAETQLRPVLDDEAGLHYGAAISELNTADRVSVAVDSPPQTARHQGYETSFIRMDELTYTID